MAEIFPVSDIAVNTLSSYLYFRAIKNNKELYFTFIPFFFFY